MDLSVDSGTYIRLSAVMFLEYAAWGAGPPCWLRGSWGR